MVHTVHIGWAGKAISGGKIESYALLQAFATRHPSHGLAVKNDIHHRMSIDDIDVDRCPII